MVNPPPWKLTMTGYACNSFAEVTGAGGAVAER